MSLKVFTYIIRCLGAMCLVGCIYVMADYIKEQGLSKAMANNKRLLFVLGFGIFIGLVVAFNPSRMIERSYIAQRRTPKGVNNVPYIYLLLSFLVLGLLIFGFWCYLLN
jgi:hypothetical protein